MLLLMVFVFILGYTMIALEHPLKIDKAAPALLIGVLLWVIYILDGYHILNLGFSRAWTEYLAINPEANTHEGVLEFISHNQILEHLSEISTILFFLLGAMTIVEIIDHHQGFKVITDKIKTTKKVKLLWILSFLTFFMSAALDNLTTTIVMVALLRKLVADKETRWFFASMVVLAANAGGAWSPIGDVTTIMLWIGQQVTAGEIIMMVFVPSLATMIFPLIILSFTMKGEVERPKINNDEIEFTTQRERIFILCLGIGALLFVPVFKTITHLPPYLGMLLGLSVIWITTEIMHRDKLIGHKKHLKVTSVLGKVDTPTILFFLGILSAVAALQSAGQLDLLAKYLDENLGNIFAIDLAIGILSSVVDNVPLVAGAMGMYDITSPENVQGFQIVFDAIKNGADINAIHALANSSQYSGEVLEGIRLAVADIDKAGGIGNVNNIQDLYQYTFRQNGLFWEFLAYCAGTGGSILIIGSAAGVAAMGMEKIDFIWYLRKISLLALIGYLGGAAVYYLQALLFHF